jgi:hypothetical protein
MVRLSATDLRVLPASISSCFTFNSYMHTSTSIWLIKLYQFCIHHILGQPCSFGRSVYQSVHNSVMPSKRKVTLILAPSSGENISLREECLRSSDLILNKSINKNSIISKYNEDCHKLGYSGQLTSTKKGEPTHLPTTYPSIFQLVRDCSMKPDTSHYYRVQDLWFENIIVIVLKPV